jgi:hypothetical protein
MLSGAVEGVSESCPGSDRHSASLALGEDVPKDFMTVERMAESG